MNALELFSLKNRVAVVLGGTSGIGLAIAPAYANPRAIAIAGSRDPVKVDGGFLAKEDSRRPPQNNTSCHCLKRPEGA